MSLEKYKPLPFERFGELTSSYECLKELCNRGLYWLDGNKKPHSINETYEKFGEDVFKRLFCSNFDESKSLYPHFEFSKKSDDETRLLRFCGRAVFVHSLRAFKHTYDTKSSPLTQKLALMHDIIENKWNYFVVLSNLKEFDWRNFHYVTSLKLNFIEFDITKTNLDALRQECQSLPDIIKKEFGEQTGAGVIELTNLDSIQEKLSLLGNEFKEHEKNLDYLSILLNKALDPGGEAYVPIVEARTADRIDNIVTMMYLFPEEQLRFLDKTAIHLKGCVDIIRQKKMNPADSFFKLASLLIDVSQKEALRNFTLHAYPPLDGYRLEYRMDHFEKKFEEQLDKLTGISRCFEELKVQSKSAE